MHCTHKFWWLAFIPVVFMACSSPQEESELQSLGSKRVWWKGDLHAHSRFSDGKHMMKDVLQAAENMGLDYFILTDHDNVQLGNIRHWNSQDYRSEKLRLLYGVEWTSIKGHTLLLSYKPFVYGGFWRDNLTLNAKSMLERAEKLNLLACIAHPKEEGIFSVTRWRYKETSSCLEVWNGDFARGKVNQESLRFWQERLAQGEMVTAVGGSDMHSVDGSKNPKNILGTPTTWVHVEHQSSEGVIESIKKGRVTLSENPHAPRLELYIYNQVGRKWGIGDEVPLENGKMYRTFVHTHVNASLYAEGRYCVAKIYTALGILASRVFLCNQEVNFYMSERLEKEKQKFIRAEFWYYDEKTHKETSPVAITNPIYLR